MQVCSKAHCVRYFSYCVRSHSHCAFPCSKAHCVRFLTLTLGFGSLRSLTLTLCVPVFESSLRSLSHTHIGVWLTAFAHTHIVRSRVRKLTAFAFSHSHWGLAHCVRSFSHLRSCSKAHCVRCLSHSHWVWLTAFAFSLVLLLLVRTRGMLFCPESHHLRLFLYGILSPHPHPPP